MPQLLHSELNFLSSNCYHHCFILQFLPPLLATLLPSMTPLSSCHVTPLCLPSTFILPSWLLPLYLHSSAAITCCMSIIPVFYSLLASNPQLISLNLFFLLSEPQLAYFSFGCFFTIIQNITYFLALALLFLHFLKCDHFHDPLILVYFPFSNRGTLCVLSRNWNWVMVVA